MDLVVFGDVLELDHDGDALMYLSSRFRDLHLEYRHLYNISDVSLGINTPVTTERCIKYRRSI